MRDYIKILFAYIPKTAITTQTMHMISSTIFNCRVRANKKIKGLDSRDCYELPI